MNVIFQQLHIHATLYRVIILFMTYPITCKSVNYQLNLFMFFVRVFVGRCIIPVEIFVTKDHDITVHGHISK